jgi:hypothetical protein
MQAACQQLQQQQRSPPSQHLRSPLPTMLGTCHLGAHNTAGAQQRRRNPALAISAAAGPPEPASGELAPAQGAPQTRLQQQAQDLLAIDVECAHFRVPGQRRVQHLPAEVCLVDGQGNTVLRTHCNPRECLALRGGYSHQTGAEMRRMVAWKSASQRTGTQHGSGHAAILPINT